MHILIESTFVVFNRRLHVPKYTVSNIISNSLIINELLIEKYVLLSGGLEVSFSIVKGFFHVSVCILSGPNVSGTISLK